MHFQVTFKEDMLGIKILAIHVKLIQLSAPDYATAYAEATLKLELYDMVQVDKFYDAGLGDGKNYFEGWLMS